MKTIFQRRTLLAASLALGLQSLGGCAAMHQADLRESNANRVVDQSMQQLRSSVPDTKAIEPVTVHRGAYLLGESIPVANRQINPVLQQKIVFSSAAPITLDQAAAQVSQMIEIPVHVAAEVETALHGGQQQTSVTSTVPTSTTGLSFPALPGLPSASTQASLPNVSNQPGMLKVSWDGPLSGLLDMLAAQSGCYWNYSASSGVRFYLTQTRVFDISALPGTSSVTSSVSNSGTSGGSTSSSGSSGSGGTTGSTGTTSQTASMKTDVDAYKDIEANVKSIMSAAGGSAQPKSSASVNTASGQLIVTGTPPQIEAVAQYVKALNAQLLQNVLIDVHVYAVSTNSSDAYNINLQGALSQLLGSTAGKFTLGSAAASISGATQAGLSLVSGNFSANAVAQALSTVGKVSLVTSRSVLAVNGQPTPMQVAQQRSYVQSVSTTTTANVGSSTSITPGQYTTGFSGVFLPMVRDKNVILQYTINLTQDSGLQTFSSGGSTVQLPNLATQAFQQRVVVRSGQTVVISGFEQAGSTASMQGTGSPDFMGLGGGRNAATSRTALVIVLHVQKEDVAQ